MEVRFISRKSKTCKMIQRSAGIPLLGKGEVPEVVVNYGLAGNKFEKFMWKNERLRRCVFLNRKVGYSKWWVVKKAEEMGVPTPESKLELDRGDRLEDWIEKSFASIGGKGIKIAEGREEKFRRYYQRLVKNRDYEIRVHAFMWLPENKWGVQKRLGEEGVLTWNYKTGGRFVTVKQPMRYRVFKEAIGYSKDLLEELGMQFGAMDFVVENGRGKKVWFLEVNSAPGVSGLSDEIYVEAFRKLKEMEKGKVREMVEGRGENG